MNTLTFEYCNHPYFLGAVLYCKENACLLYQADHFQIWQVDIEVPLKQFLDECEQGQHTAEGTSMIFYTFADAMEALFTL